MSIVKKMVVGYFVIVFVPVLSFGIYFYNQVYDNMLQRFGESRQQIIRQAYSNLQVEMTNIESIYQLLQYNAYVVEYLDGTYAKEGDSVYSFLKYIRPLLAYPMLGRSEIQSIRLYKNKPEVFPIVDQVIDLSELDERRAIETSSLPPGKGMWFRDAASPESLELLYVQPIYNDRFTEKLGLMEVRVRPGMLDQFFEALGSRDGWEIYLLSGAGEPLQARNADPKRPSFDLARLKDSSDNAVLFNGDFIANGLALEELDMKVVVVGRGNELFRSINEREVLLIGGIVLLLLTLSVIYYTMFLSIGRRISRLSRHMRYVGEDSLRLVDVPRKQDEIGSLYGSYNAMIRRIDELINNVHRAELRHKEAAYKVLQAQVKPHFLYNTLESIRMLAVANDDTEVAEVSFAFGQLMRYSLGSRREDTELAAELDIVANFLKVHKVRFRDRLHYELDVQADIANVYCPRFMLQPLVENCVVHGLSKVRRPVFIRIAVRETPSEIVVEIADDGAGIPGERLQAIRSELRKPGGGASSAADTEGIGLINVSERIKSFFKGNSRLEIDGKEGAGTACVLYLDKGGVMGRESAAGG
ncbi:sensor histidine kinase [Cohnella cellulosilytica]|uniref:Sensor histidine kinase n=1 Tax=Cohnella cellulosilytica TaxID=986710 RepID=A0ABW2FKH8_9BACL